MPAPPVHFHELHKIEACLGHDLCMRRDMPTQVGHLFSQCLWIKSLHTQAYALVDTHPTVISTNFG